MHEDEEGTFQYHQTVYSKGDKAKFYMEDKLGTKKQLEKNCFCIIFFHLVLLMATINDKCDDIELK